LNGANFKAVNISKEDYFDLPPAMRAQSDSGPLVLSMIQGRETFVPANITEPRVW
jgi:hypothetical protein